MFCSDSFKTNTIIEKIPIQVLPVLCGNLWIPSEFILVATRRCFFANHCCCSVTKLCPALCDPMDCSTPGSPVLHCFPELAQITSIESVMPSSHLILCHPILLPSVFPSIRVFSSQLALCIRWPKYWSFRFSISPSNEYSGLISFRMDWLDLLAVQGTLKSLLQHHSSKASILLL